MRVLYVGHYNVGSTTRMRGEFLQKLLNPREFVIADIDIPISRTPRLFLSLGWRYKKGPLISNINSYLKQIISGSSQFDLVWIDKGVFIEPSLIGRLKRKDNLLVHYTPDTAFYGNESDLFYKSLPLYDFCITTKSFEMESYQKMDVKRLLICTQGYDPRVHRPYFDYSEKTGIVFVGLAEPSREEILEKLLEKKFVVKLAGRGWNKFVSRNRHKDNFHFYGPGVFSEDYGKLISGSLIGLGLLSKMFPEKHTTRTFEIPACGTALLTEKNEETEIFFQEKDVIFFGDGYDMIEKVEEAMNDKDYLKSISERGRETVLRKGFDYSTIMNKLLVQIGLQE